MCSRYGTHCKQVRAVLFACTEFIKKKHVLIEQTCTEKLQTFHHAKRYTGSPLKSDELDMPGADEVTNMAFDPRPAPYRNMPGYSSFFQNACLNFNGISEMPIFQIFPPANTFAYAHAHDYLE